MQQTLSAIPGVQVALVGGKCCAVFVNTNVIPDPTTLRLTVNNPPISTNTCEYTTTSFQWGTFAGNGEYAVDSSLGAHQGSNATTGPVGGGPDNSSALADAGVQAYFPTPTNGLTWNGWKIVANLKWHIRGTMSADDNGVLGRSGTASASVNLNLVHNDYVDPEIVTAAMSDSVKQGDSAKSVSRDYTDNVTNQTQLFFSTSDNSYQAAYIQSISQTTAQASLGANASADADFATGDPVTRNGPQAWMDDEIWQFTPPQSGWYVADCGPK